MSNSKKLVGNIMSLGFVQIANYIFPLISVPIITRIIGPDKYGVINYAGAFVIYFVFLVSYGFDLTATRRIAQDPMNRELRNTVFSEVLKCKFFLFLISILLFIPCLFYVGPLKGEKTVAIFSFLNVCSYVLTQNWMFQAMQNLKKVAILNLIGKLIFTLSVLLIIRQKSDYIWQPLVISTSQIIISVLSFFWVIKIYQIKIIPVSMNRVFAILNEDKTMFFSMVVISLYTATNTVVLGLMKNSTEVGYYTASGKLMDVASTVVNIPLAQALFPFVGKALGESKEKGIKTVQKLTPVVFYITLIAGIGMFLLGPTVLRMFYGEAFEASIPVFRIMSFIPMIIALSNIFGIQVMLNLKMDKPFFYITFCGAILGILLNFVMIHFYSYIGTAWNWLLVEFFITTTMYVYIRRQGINPIKVPYFLPSNIFKVIKDLKK